MMSLATCPRCSARLPGDANYCRRCGEMLRAPSAPVAQTLNYRTPAPAAAPVRGNRPAAKKSGGGFWWVVIAAFMGYRCYDASNRHYTPPTPRVIPVPQMPSFSTPVRPDWPQPVTPAAPQTYTNSPWYAPPTPAVPRPPTPPAPPTWQRTYGPNPPTAPQPAGHR